MKNRSLVTQFRLTLIFIILTSIVATIITYVVVAVWFMISLQNNQLNPANYYENQIPQIEEYITKAKSNILSSANEETLNQQIKGDELYYQIVDNKNNILYGSYMETIFETKKQLFECLDTKFINSGYYVRVVPVINDDEQIAGAVSLLYKVSLTSANKDKAWINIVLIITLLSPIIYMIIFSFLFSRIYGKNISKPLQILMDGSRQIKEKNLNFEIDYQSNNELGQLCVAFSEMKDELKTALSIQWKLEQERVDMVEALAHDLKSPLSVIKAYSEALIDDTKVDEEQRQYLSIIEANIEKSISLVQQMQYTSDLDRSSFHLIQLPLDLPKFLTQKIHDYEMQAKQKDITIKLNIEGSIPTFITMDKEKLERIFDNLISNSLEYTPFGGDVEILVKAQGKYIYYSICDTGRGFSPKDKDKAFEKFYRGDKARQIKDGHSGLGLYNVKKLVELLGGDIKIENSKSGGACVVFYHSI